MKLVNLTPHTITIVLTNGANLQIPPSGDVARVTVDRIPSGALGVDGHTVPIRVAKYGALIGLPDRVEGVALIVSALVRLAAGPARRGDVFSPGDLVRDSAGQPTGCYGLEACGEA